MTKFKLLITFTKKLKPSVNMVESNSLVGPLHAGSATVSPKPSTMFSERKTSFNKADNRWPVIKKKRDKNCKCSCLETSSFQFFRDILVSKTYSGLSRMSGTQLLNFQPPEAFNFYFTINVFGKKKSSLIPFCEVQC